MEILTRVLSHTDCVPPDLIDRSAIPMTVSIIREGPWLVVKYDRMIDPLLGLRKLQVVML